MNINLYSGLSPRAQQVLRKLASMGTSEGLYVASALNEIASNAEQEKLLGATPEELSSQDSHLVSCAKELIDAAQEVIDALEVAPAAEELLELFKSKNLEDDETALDDEVHSVASQAGTNANNGGVSEQIAYLLHELGVEQTRKIIESLS